MIQASDIIKGIMEGEGPLSALARPMAGNEDHLYLNGALQIPMAGVIRRPLAQFIGEGVPANKIRIAVATREQAGGLRLATSGADATEKFAQWLVSSFAVGDGEEFFHSPDAGGSGSLLVRSLKVVSRDPRLASDVFDVRNSNWSTNGVCQAYGFWGTAEGGEVTTEKGFQPVAQWAPESGGGLLLEDVPRIGCETMLVQVVVAPPTSGDPSLARAVAAPLGLCDDETLILLVGEPSLVGVVRELGGPEGNNVLGDTPNRLLNDSLTRHLATARQIAIGLYRAWSEQFPKEEVPDVPETSLAALELGLVGMDHLVRGTVKEFMDDSEGIYLGQAEQYSAWLLGTTHGDRAVGEGMVAGICEQRRLGDDLSIDGSMGERGIVLALVRRNEKGEVIERFTLNG